nr:RHS repeat domain-containing protein [uncultured Flavobacterium sp.]
MKNILLVSFLIKFSLLLSQNGKDNYFPPSPEANTLIKYVDVPVNYSTGVINHSIPIHNIKLKNLTVPITLSYQSSGFKPTEIASNVGLGWELNVGGKITQNVIGKNDIQSSSPAHNYWDLPNNRDIVVPQPQPDIYFGSSETYWTSTRLDSLNGPNTDYTMFKTIEDYGLDTQADLFYFSTPTKSGKFFFGANYETKQIPFGKEKIIFNSNGNPFEIIDIDGVKYKYGIVAENINYTTNTCQTIPRLNGSSTNYSYTYYLTQITTPNNETVDFIYDTVKYNLINDKDYTRYYHSVYGGTEKTTSFYSEITAKVLTKIVVNQNYEIQFLYSKFRKDIKGTNEETAPKTLDTIKIKYNNEIESFSFDYGYFGINPTEYNPSVFEPLTSNENTTYRLKLNHFKKNGENPHLFSYFSETAVERFTQNLDHWGYHNNIGGRYTINTLFGDFNTNTKKPFLENSQTNVLKNIILPTKGEVEFVYELNDCSSCDISYPEYNWETYSIYSNSDDNFSNEWQTNNVFFTVPENYISTPVVKFNVFDNGELTTTNNTVISIYDDQNNSLDFPVIGAGLQTKPYQGNSLQPGKTYRLVLECVDNIENENKFVQLLFLTSNNVATPNTVAGGIRIKSITASDANMIKSSRSFDYNYNGKSSGILYEKPSYNDEYAFFVPGNPDQDGTNMFQLGLFLYGVQYSRMPIDLFGFGGSHIFYQKVTETKSDVNNLNNQIKVEKYFTFYDDLRYGEQTYFDKISYNWKRGLLSVVNELKNNTTHRKTSYSYSFLDTNNCPSLSLIPNYPKCNPTYANEYHQRSINIVDVWRNPNVNMYFYNSTKLISAWYYMDKKTTEEVFDGNTLKTEEEYFYNDPTHAQLTSQKTTNSNNLTIETKYLYPDDFITEPLMIELKAANRISTPVATEQYKSGILLSKNKTVYAKDSSTSNLLLPKSLYQAKFPNILPSILNIGNLEKKITYDKYDIKGNVLQYTPENGAPVSIIWGYDQIQPIAKIENATYAQVEALSGFGLGFTVTTELTVAQETTLRTSLSSAMITTYTYKPLIGVNTITDPKGDTITYSYDAFGRLQNVKDKNNNILSENEYHYKN